MRSMQMCSGPLGEVFLRLHRERVYREDGAQCGLGLKPSSRAVVSRAEPNRAEPNRAEPSRDAPEGRAFANRGSTSH
ncbi:hypothetical protein PsYK624_063540 [Phanerochaete sordida]|uniref:Uncharacterized protein n=1 Tax=Phanerochaete sordida TaxID=48140 RepID=A0A9P3G8L4_9APHY|nr:hypothetical protein PsYK624_063540 [Phanerochaete sordida]